MSVFASRTRAENIIIPHAVNLTWKNPTFPEFKEVVIYRDSSLAFVYDPSLLNTLDEVYRGTAESVYDFSTTESAVLNPIDIPDYQFQTEEERHSRLVGEKTYKYYFVVEDIYGNIYGGEDRSINAIPTKYYGLGEELYNTLPMIYRTEDAKYNFPLKRFLQLTGRVLDYVKSQGSIIRSLIDPYKCPKELLPYLSKNAGAYFWEDIPAVYQRRFLSRFGELVAIKGTKGAILFIINEIFDGFTAEVETIGKNVTIALTQYEMIGGIEEEPVSTDKVMRYIEEFLPIDVNASVEVRYGYQEYFRINRLIADSFIETLIRQPLYESEFRKKTNIELCVLNANGLNGGLITNTFNGYDKIVGTGEILIYEEVI